MNGFESGELVADRFWIVRRLSPSAFGTVYLAEEDGDASRRVAIRVLDLAPDLSQALAERVEQESRAAVGFDHPDVVATRELLRHDNLLIYVMDFVEALSLRELLCWKGPLPIRRGLQRVREVLEALSFAHRHDLVHGSLQPGNVAIAGAGSDSERAMLLGLGVPRYLVRRLARRGAPAATEVSGPAEGRASEVILGRLADVCAMGHLLSRFLDASRPPRREASTKDPGRETTGPMAMHDDVDLPLALRRTVVDLVRRAIGLSAEAPFTTADDMISAIDALGLAHVREAPPRRQVPATPPRLTLPVRGRVHGPPLVLGGAQIRIPSQPGQVTDRIFCTMGTQLRYGRAVPGKETVAQENNLIMRVLPCRTEEIDPENIAATVKISHRHGTIVQRGSDLFVVDHSEHGTWLDGERLPDREPTKLPSCFLLDVAGVLTLKGMVHPVLRSDASPPEALLLQRVDNQAGDAYLWVLRSAFLGALDDAILRFSDTLEVRIDLAEEKLLVTAAGPLFVSSAKVGDEVFTPKPGPCA
ncbi:FHA domain-containing serine/threonine-protein kinase [Planctomycetota bacterium]